MAFMPTSDALGTLLVEAGEAAIALWIELGSPVNREQFNDALNAHPEYKIYLETHLHPMDKTSIYGSCYTANNETWVTCLRAGATRWQQDFAFYHEVGHVVRGDTQEAGCLELVTRDDLLTTPHEVFADAFAHTTMRLIMYGDSAIAMAPGRSSVDTERAGEIELLEDFYRRLRG